MSRWAVRAVFGITGVVMLSRVLGMVREIVIADSFGTSPEYDLYLIAIMLPALAYGVLNYAFYYLLVPYLTRQLESDNTFRRNSRLPDSVWSVLSGTLFAALMVAGLIVVLAPYVMKIWGSGYSVSEYERIVWYARAVAAAVVLGASEAFLRALLNSIKQFTYPAGGFIVFNLFSIAAIFAGAPRFGVGALALALVGGLLAQNIYLFARLAATRWFSGFRLAIEPKELSALWGIAGVLVLVELLGRSYFMIDRYFALPLGDGIVAALNYSNVLVVLPDSIVGFAIGSVLFPLFSERKDADEGRFSRLYVSGISIGLMVALPAAAFVYLNAGDIIRLIFMRGAFDSESLLLTTAALKTHSPAIVALFVISTSIRACYARGWGRSVLMASAGLLAIKFISTWLLSEYIGFAGIPLATSMTQLGFAAVLVMIVRKKMPGALTGVGVNLLKVSLATAIAVTVLITIRTLTGDMLGGATLQMVATRVALSAALLAGVYIGLVYTFGLTDLYKRVKAK